MNRIENTLNSLTENTSQVVQIINSLTENTSQVVQIEGDFCKLKGVQIVSESQINYKVLYLEQKQKVKKLLSIQSITENAFQHQKTHKFNQQIKRYQQAIQELKKQCKCKQMMLKDLQDSLQKQANIYERKKAIQYQTKLILQQQNSLLIQQLQEKVKTIKHLKQKQQINSNNFQKCSCKQDRQQSYQETQKKYLINAKIQDLQKQLTKFQFQTKELLKKNQLSKRQIKQSTEQIIRLNKQIKNITDNTQTQLNFYKDKLQQLTQQLLVQRAHKNQLKEKLQFSQAQTNRLAEFSQSKQTQNKLSRKKCQKYQAQIVRLQNQQSQIYCQLQKAYYQMQELKVYKKNCLQEIKWYRSLLQQAKSNFINSELQKQEISKKLKRQNLELSKRTARTFKNQSFNQSTYDSKRKLNESCISNTRDTFQDSKNSNKQNISSQSNLSNNYCKFVKQNKKQNWSIYTEKTPSKNQIKS